LQAERVYKQPRVPHNHKHCKPDTRYHLDPSSGLSSEKARPVSGWFILFSQSFIPKL
jgi:uncharacterized protein YcnI